MANDDLINTLEQSGEFDALAKLRPGEPYFALIGRDRIAPELVEEWADRNRRRAIDDFNADPSRINKEEYERECRKSTQAEMLAAEMRAYKRGHKPTADAPQKSESYVGAELDEDTKRRDALQAARARASSALGGAIAELTIAAKLLEPETDSDSAIVHLQAVEALSHMELIAKTIHPLRRGLVA